MRGYFGIGIDGAAKAGNMGNLVRTAHSFGAAFVFALNPMRDHRDKAITSDFADTARTHTQLPFYEAAALHDLPYPVGARIIAVELSEDAVDLPSFRHPQQAVYVLGAEWHGVSPEVMERADQVVKIPTKFSLNVATAGAIVMYDRMRLLGGFAERPVMTGQKPRAKPAHVQGNPKARKAKKAAREAAEK